MKTEILLTEIHFKGIRSSGAGGQNVNKVASKIEVTFDVKNSNGLTEAEKERLYQTLSSKLTKENVLIFQCDESRSQHKNKDLSIKRFLKTISNGLKVPKPRKATKPSKSSILKRLEKKKFLASKKENRKKPNL
jgi:ribosome-associated protein